MILFFYGYHFVFKTSLEENRSNYKGNKSGRYVSLQQFSMATLTTDMRSPDTSFNLYWFTDTIESICTSRKMLQCYLTSICFFLWERRLNNMEKYDLSQRRSNPSTPVPISPMRYGLRTQQRYPLKLNPKCSQYNTLAIVFVLSLRF